MYSDSIASSSRLTMQDMLEFVDNTIYFPCSSSRLESYSPDVPPRRIPPPTLAANPKTSATSRFTSSYPTDVPRRWEVSPGVFTDGTSTVYSSALPEVQQLLADGRKTLVLPQPSSDIILTLAALHVFYNPLDPAHWLFWSDEKKSSTADVVTRISLHNPPLITSPVAWNGKPEYLCLLAIHHGASWKVRYESQEWYLKVVPPPKPVTPHRLRLRHTRPGALREPSPGLEDDIDDTIPLRGVQNSRPTLARTVVKQPPTKARRSGQGKGKAKDRSSPEPVSEVPTMQPTSILDDADDALTPLSAISELTPEPPTKPIRRKRKVASPSQTPEMLSNTQLSPEPSLLLGPEPTHLTQAVNTHHRTRSTSTDTSSTSTAVDPTGSRSSSVASAVTIVATTTISAQKRKAEAIEVEETAEIEIEDDTNVKSTARPRKRAKGVTAKPPAKRKARTKA